MNNVRFSRSRMRRAWQLPVRKRRLVAEQLESRHLLASDIEHVQLLNNWVPSSDELSWSDISLRLSSTATAEQWQRALAPHADRLSNLDANTPDFRINDLRYDASTATTFVYLQQTLNGLDIVNAYANLAVQSNGTISSIYSSFVDTTKMNTSVQRFAELSPESALTALAHHYGWPNVSGTRVAAISPLAIGQIALIEAPAVAREAVAYANAYVPRENGQLEPAWRLNVQPVVSDSWLDASVSQLDGSVLFVADWTADAQYEVFAYPKESPSDGPRTRVVDPANSTTSPYGWHDTDGITGPESVRTRGNNTVAYRDTDANNRPDIDSYVNGGASLTFAPPLDLTQEPATYAEASTVNLFYTTNRLHDIFANKGFYAEAGNFQRNNYDATRGLAHDPIFAEDLDGGGFNNASMTVPPDGRFGRMQMRLFNYTTPARSSSLDNGIIAHEFAHGVTIRLTGGPNNSSGLSSLQSAAMGEGWSDFFALLFTQTTSDTAQQGRGIGTYLLGQLADGPGMRTQKYSYDMSINTLTFGDIAGQTDPHVMGEVWAATLWDLSWALIGGRDLDPKLKNVGLGFNTNLNATTGGNNVAFRTVLHALKFQPINPTFLQARDAILRADQVLNAGANQETIWRVFARRGMGYSAIASRSSSSIVTEAFDTPVIGSIDFVRQGLLGSGIATASGTLASTLGINGSQRLTFDMAADTRVSFKLSPGATTAVLTVTLRRADGAIVRAPETGAAGAAVVISSWSGGQAGDYVLEVSANAVTRVRLEAARNAALESQGNDSSGDAEFGLNNSFRAFARGGVNAVVGQQNSSAARMTKGSDASKFIDIGETGTAIPLGNDGLRRITTTVGNRIFPAGNVLVFSGLIMRGTINTLPSTNSRVTHVATQGIPMLLAYWDDFHTNGQVFLEERQVNGVATLIVQWDRSRYSGAPGDGTFQVQVFASGPVLARYAYRDLNFGSRTYNNGASATIGWAGTDSFIDYSFNRVSVTADDYLDILPGDDTDEYRFSAEAGQKIDVAFDLLNASGQTSIVRLLDAADNVLATANAKPVSTTTAVANYDLGILGFVVPTTGDYSIEVLAADGSEYYLAVTESLTLDTENANGIITPARALSLPGAALGYMSASDPRDLLDIDLASGETVRVILSLTDNASGQPGNTLLPRVNITAPSGAIIATSSTVNTDRQILLSTTATQSGRHRIDLRRLAGQGEYYLRVEQVVTNAAATPTAISLLAAPLSFSDKPSIASAWHNLAQPMDVSDDLQVTALDALLLINELNNRRISTNKGELPPRPERPEVVDLLYDTNNDGLLTAVDALLVINELNSKPF